MDGAIHRFVRLLRLHEVRVSTSETVDACRAAATPGVLGDREHLRAALRMCLIKDARDEATFERIFASYFSLAAVMAEGGGHGHSHAHDDLADEGELEQFVLSEDPGTTPSSGHSHGKPEDIRDYFDTDDMAKQFNLHQEANKLDLAALTDEIVVSQEPGSADAAGARIQLDTSRLHNPGTPGDLIQRPGTSIDAELTVAEETALLAWLDDGSQDAAPERGLDGDELAALRQRLAGLLDGLPLALKRHLERLLASDLEIESREAAATAVAATDEHERRELELALRRIARSFRGAPRPRRREAARGEIDASRTMRRNLRHDGVPFRPVTVTKSHDQPRLMVLVDVSLSVRSAARFTLQLVHGLQGLVPHVRTFAFVADLIEVTDVFDEHPLEEALSLVVRGLPAGGLLDVDADSDYGAALSTFLEEHGGAVNRRTTLLILGDGRSNGRDPGLPAFEELARRARQTVWLTPEPRWSWRLGACDLPAYAAACGRVEVVRDLVGLDRVGELAVTR